MNPNCSPSKTHPSKITPPQFIHQRPSLASFSPTINNRFFPWGAVVVGAGGRADGGVGFGRTGGCRLVLDKYSA